MREECSLSLFAFVDVASYHDSGRGGTIYGIASFCDDASQLFLTKGWHVLSQTA